MVITDAIVRLLPNVLKKEEAIKIESFSPDLKKLIKESASNVDRYLEYPQYTRPENFHNLKVPEVLLSGNHKKIQAWQTKQIKKQNCF